MYIKRSGEALLSIGIDNKALQANQFTQRKDFLTNALSRLERLSIKWGSNSIFELGAPAMPAELTEWIDGLINGQHSLPKLWQFHVKTPDRKARTRVRGTFRRFPLLSDLHLQTISLRSTLPTSSLLTRVSAACIGLTAKDIITFLASSPLLEEVSLQHSFDKHVRMRFSLNDDNDERPRASAAAASLAPIHLAHLDNFSLGWCSGEFISDITNIVTFPDTARVALSVQREEGGGVFDAFPRSLEETLSASVVLFIVMRRMNEDADVPFTLGFKSATSPVFKVMYPDEWGGPDDFGNMTDDRLQDAKMWIEDLGYRNTFPHLTEVTITAKALSELSVNALAMLFKSFTKVQQLMIRTNDADRVLKALSTKNIKDEPDSDDSEEEEEEEREEAIDGEDNEDSQTSGMAVRPCPVLRSLDIRTCAFDPAVLEKTIEGRSAWTDEPLSRLILTFDPQLRNWEEGGRDAAEVLKNIEDRVEMYEAEDGYWTDEEGEADGGHDEDEDEDEEGWGTDEDEDDEDEEDDII